jgi:hypothetical protein
MNVDDHFKPARKYRNDPASQGCVGRRFSSEQARYKVLLSGLFEIKVPLFLKHLTCDLLPGSFQCLLMAVVGSTESLNATTATGVLATTSALEPSGGQPILQ